MADKIWESCEITTRFADGAEIHYNTSVNQEYHYRFKHPNEMMMYFGTENEVMQYALANGYYREDPQKRLLNNNK